jgi:PAS domain S-box-containing protein
MGRATNDLVWDWDIVRDTTWRGEGIRSVFGYGPEEATAPDFWSSRIHPDDRDRVLGALSRFLESAESGFTAEYRVRRKDGTYASVLERGYAVRSSEGKAVRMVGATMDLSARKQMEERLAQAQRINSLGRIAASIAHEFNNVLMGLQPNLEILRRRTPEELHPVIQNLLQSVARGKRVTDEIFNFTRRVTSRLAPVDVDLFLQRWAAEARPQLGNGVRLVCDVAPHLFMLADEAQLAQVLTNLALNARDAMPGGGTLTIKVTRMDDVVLLGTDSHRRSGVVQFRVTDTGEGIAANDLDQIFEPLFTTKPGGLGLGLAVSHQIVMRHHGLITVASRQGEGTTFSVLIPAAEPSGEKAPGESMERAEVQRVLLVEDEEAVSEGLKILFELEGIEVEAVKTGRGGLEALERRLPDVLVLDIGLPDISGIEVYAAVEKRYPELPVVFSSGHGDDAQLLRWRERPNVRVLLKPYDFAALEQAISELRKAP